MGLGVVHISLAVGSTVIFGQHDALGRERKPRTPTS
jgi:hypothetical protein